jgi:predicted Fe-Mo cluster-binding NifX family protein
VIFCISVDENEHAGGGWGRAQTVALARIETGGQIEDWQLVPVGWGELHGSGTEGSHHARIVRFLKEHQVGCVITGHMGPGMVRVMEAMNIPVFVGAAGPARALAEQAAATLARPDAGPSARP